MEGTPVRRIAATLLAVLLSAPFASADATVVREHRVANRDPGICWFCCAETAGRSLGITPLVGLTGKVEETGVGLRGATDASIVGMVSVSMHACSASKTVISSGPCMP